MRKKAYCILGFFYWLLWVSMFFIGKPKEESAVDYIKEETWRIIYLTIVNWFLLEKLRSYFTKKITDNFFLVIKWLIAIVLFIAGGFLWSYIAQWIHIGNAMKGSNRSIILTLLFMGLLSFAYFGIIRFYVETTQLKVKASDLQMQKQMAELSLLKSQTNPHFLFNTLNNIYGLAREQNQLTADAILKLSEILRFTLYKSAEKFIPLEQELQIMEDYINLEKLRYSNEVMINFSKQIANSTTLIPPLLLLPLAENAFKHGASEMLDKPIIDIHVYQQQNNFECKIVNAVNRQLKNGQKEIGIGLPNLKMQLNLLYKEYSLDVIDKDDFFSICLKINLNSYVDY